METQPSLPLKYWRRAKTLRPTYLSPKMLVRWELWRRLDYFKNFPMNFSHQYLPHLKPHLGCGWDSGRARVFAYNPKAVTTLPTSIDDLTDPSWSSKIGIAPTNASFQAFVTALRIIRGDEATENWLTKIVANNPKLFEKNSQIVEAIDAGQIQLGLVNHYYTWEVSKALGREINAVNGFFGPGDAGNLINVSGAGVFNTSKNQSLANKLIEYLLAEKTQKRFVSENHEYSVLPNLITPSGQPTLKEIGAPIVNLDSLKDLKQTQELLIKVGLL